MTLLKVKTFPEKKDLLTNHIIIKNAKEHTIEEKNKHIYNFLKLI